MELEYLETIITTDDTGVKRCRRAAAEACHRGRHGKGIHHRKPFEGNWI
jgi:hypothetical protein